MAKHFHVLVGLCGLYMPDDNQVYRTRREAENAAKEIARQYRDEGETVKGTSRDGYYRVGADYCIEINDCEEAECLRDT